MQKINATSRNGIDIKRTSHTSHTFTWNATHGWSHAVSSTGRTLGSIDNTLTETINNLEGSLRAISESSNLESLWSASNAFLGIVNYIDSLTGSADKVASSLSNSVDEAFGTATDIISGLTVLDELPTTLNNKILNVRDSLNGIFRALSLGASGTEISIFLDSSFVNAGRTLLILIDAVSAITYVANSISGNINEIIAAAVIALSVVLSTILSLSEVIMIVGAAASGDNASIAVTYVINGVKAAAKIVLNVLKTIINVTTSMTSTLSDVSSLLRAATSALIDGAGQIINVGHAATGMISGLSSSLSTIVFSLTKSLDDEAGSIISGVCGISGGIGGALGDLLDRATALWGLNESLDDVVTSLSGIVNVAASSTGDVSGICNGIASEGTGDLSTVTNIIYEAIDMITNLGVSFVVDDIISIIGSVFRNLVEGVVSVSDGIGLGLSNIIKNDLNMVNAALSDITTITGSITHNSGVPATLKVATYRLANAIYSLVKTISLITEKTVQILENLANAEPLANAIATLPVILSVVLLLAQGILILISGALVIVTGAIYTPVHTLTSTVVYAVQSAIDIIAAIIGSLEDGVCTRFADISNLLVGMAVNILSGISSITGSIDSVSVKISESISSCLDAIVKEIR